MKIEIRLFGAFRQYERGKPTIELEIADNATVTDLKQAMLKHFDANLVKESAIADEKSVLLASEMIGERRQLAILPPVCGG